MLVPAAKEEPVFPLAASPLSPNSHQGPQLPTALLYPGTAFVSHSLQPACAFPCTTKAQDHLVVRNSPLAMVDPSGMDPFVDPGGNGDGCGDDPLCGSLPPIGITLGWPPSSQPTQPGPPPPPPPIAPSPTPNDTGVYAGGQWGNSALPTCPVIGPVCWGVPADPKAYASALAFLFDFLTGHGPRQRYYNGGAVQSIDLQNSAGFHHALQTITASCQAGKTGGAINVGTGEAGLSLPSDIWSSPTGVQVGGYNGTWGVDGTSIDLNITSYAGLKSFAYHRLPNRQSATGPLSTIVQKFSFKVPNPCADSN
jgi:hypothetical protein